MDKNLYIITVFHIEKKNEEDFKKEAKIKSIIYNREITVEQIKEKQMFTKADYYNFSTDEVAYFDNFKDANEFLSKNCCDVYECCFDYGVILELPLGCAYPSMYSTNIFIYKYNRDKDEYEILRKEDLEIEMYEAILAKFGYNEDIAKSYRKH